MKKYLKCAALSACALSLMVSCGSGKKTGAGSSGADLSKAEGYTFGEEVTFHTDEKETYSIFFSDASWYPMKDSWKGENGIYSEIEKLTNVHLNVEAYDSGDYTQQVNLAINSGESAYIIPKIYSEDQYVAGGGIVPISDYTQYMPNFTAFRNKYNMEPELNTIQQSDGKFYKLPGMHERALQDYTFIVRKDIFDAAGVDIKEVEKNWTWEDLHDVLLTVKKYMVENGMCKESDYIWSERWTGESGNGSGGNLLGLMGASYNVLSGWAIQGSNGGLKFDYSKNEFYSSSISPDFKKFVKIANSFVKDRILDPESFTQGDGTAGDKFYNGETVIISTNRGMYAGDVTGIDEIQGAGNTELYICVYPCGTNRDLAANSRLECGVMISNKALKELGEEKFVKMLRFVDWLFYSKEAYTLVKWGPENKTWHYVTDEDSGMKIKQLLPGLKCGGLGLSGAESDTDIRLEWGYAGGNYFYGHTTEESTDNFTPTMQDLYRRFAEYRTTAKIDPKAKADEDQREQLNLWATPLIDNINTWTLRFITGQKDIDADWDKYVADCKNLNIEQIIKMTNDIYNNQNK